jgi:hypothetical protein
LGWDVVFVEPVDVSPLADSPRAQYCARVMRRFGLDARWCLVRPGSHETAGLDRDTLRAVASRADVLLNIAGMLNEPDLIEPIPVRVYLDLDPGFVQLWHAVEGIDMRFDPHTHFVTIADTIGTTACAIPGCGRDWLPTLPPVVLSEWPVGNGVRHDALTTVAHWRGYGSVVHNGVHYGQKAHALRPLFDLPTRTDVVFRLALAIHPDDASDVAALDAFGWQRLDPAVVASTPDDYARFVQSSWGELCVAKSGYVSAQAGWFSDRSACYLASGRPVIAHDTGFGRRLPTGSGLFAFRDAGDVVAAVDELRRDYARHRDAARALAEEHLDSDRVLTSLLERVGVA